MRRHPKAITQAINITSAVIAFNRELKTLIGAIETNNFTNILRDESIAAIGLNTDTGQIQSQDALASAVSKLGGYGFNKVAKWFARSIRM